MVIIALVIGSKYNSFPDNDAIDALSLLKDESEKLSSMSILFDS